MGVFDFIKDTGSKILKGDKAEKIEAAKEAANAAKAKARSTVDNAGIAAKARGAADSAREAAEQAKARAGAQAAAAKKQAGAAKEAAAKKQAATRDAFMARRADARKADELEEYLAGLGMGGDVDVRFKDGVVYLSGSVPDQATLERVVLAVGNVEGVEQVDEELDIDAPAETEVVEAARMYTVQSGDSLSAIAKQFYGDATRYPEIFEANRPMLTDPNLIYPGQVLRIPG